MPLQLESARASSEGQREAPRQNPTCHCDNVDLGVILESKIGRRAFQSNLLARYMRGWSTAVMVSTIVIAVVPPLLWKAGVPSGMQTGHRGA